MSNVENIVQSIGEKEFNTGAATIAFVAQTLPQTERDKLLNSIQIMREGAAEHADDLREQLNSAKGLLGGKDAAINRLDLIAEQQAEIIRKHQDAETQHLFAIEQLKAELSKYTGPFGKVSVTVTNKADAPVEAQQDTTTQNVTLKLGVDTANHKEALSMADYYFARLHGALLATTPVENQAKVDEMVKDFTQVIAHALKASSNCAEPPKVIENVIAISGHPSTKLVGFDKYGRYWVASGAGWKEPGPEFQVMFDAMRVKLETELPQLKSANDSLADEVGKLALKLKELTDVEKVKITSKQRTIGRNYMPEGFDTPMVGRMGTGGWVLWYGYYDGENILVAWDSIAQRWFKVNTDAF